MNFDANTIATLMQLLGRNGSNAENSAQNASKTASTQSVDKTSEQNAFYAQNGIGERVRPDFSQGNQKSPLDMLDVGQSPMLSLLKSLGSGKGDMSAMLPMIMSLMQKQPQKSAKSEQSTQNDASAQSIDKTCDNRVQNDKAGGDNNIENARNDAKCDKQKTQRDVFAPVAFAGYEVISTLAALITSTRRPCR